MNAVFGGEITYSGNDVNEKPCFGCNIHTRSVNITWREISPKTILIFFACQLFQYPCRLL